MNLHAPQVHGFFSVPVDHLTALGVLAEHFQGQDLDSPAGPFRVSAPPQCLRLQVARQDGRVKLERKHAVLFLLISQIAAQ